MCGLGNELNFNDREYLPTIKCFDKLNWNCPDSIQLELYEIFITSSMDFRHMSSKYKINEIFLPEFNIGINKENFKNKKYNIILNSSERYNTDKFLNNEKEDKPKLIKKYILTKQKNSNELDELFDLIKSYTKSQNMEEPIKKIFEIITN